VQSVTAPSPTFADSMIQLTVEGALRTVSFPATTRNR